MRNQLLLNEANNTDYCIRMAAPPMTAAIPSSSLQLIACRDTAPALFIVASGAEEVVVVGFEAAPPGDEELGAVRALEVAEEVDPEVELLTCTIAPPSTVGGLLDEVVFAAFAA